MKKDQVARLLDHWRRPVHASDLFRFSHVLVNNKTNETVPALYTDSFAQASINGPSDWDSEYNASHPVGDNDPDLPDEASAPVIGPSETSSLVDPIVNPTLVNIDPILLQISKVSNPVIGPSETSSLVDPIVNPTPANIDPILLQISTVSTPVIEPNGSASSVVPPSKPPRPRPKRKTLSSNDPKPILQEEELGRPKRQLKRKVDIYLEAEQTAAEVAKKKKQGRK